MKGRFLLTTAACLVTALCLTKSAGATKMPTQARTTTTKTKVASHSKTFFNVHPTKHLSH